MAWSSSNRWVLALLIFVLLSSCGPQNYNDCILENLRGVSNDQVARQVARACRAKFPIQVTNRDVTAVAKCATRQMTSNELAKLQISVAEKKWWEVGDPVDADARALHYDLKFSVYNGNPIDIEKIFVRISAPNFTAPQDYEVQPPSLGKDYPLVRANTGARELRVSVATLPLDGWQYQVIGAETCNN